MFGIVACIQGKKWIREQVRHFYFRYCSRNRKCIWYSEDWKQKFSVFLSFSFCHIEAPACLAPRVCVWSRLHVVCQQCITELRKTCVKLFFSLFFPPQMCSWSFSPFSNMQSSLAFYFLYQYPSEKNFLC